jgi:hypothetical protein
MQQDDISNKQDGSDSHQTLLTGFSRKRLQSKPSSDCNNKEETTTNAWDDSRKQEYLL